MAALKRRDMSSSTNSDACYRGERWRDDGPERSLQGEDSGRFGGYAGGHIKEGPTIQAHTTWATRNGRPKNKIHIEHINTINELGM